MLVAEGKRYASGRAAPSSAAAATATSCSTTRTSRAATPRSRPRRRGWTIDDLGSTNGVRVNGRDVAARAQRSARATTSTLGTVDVALRGRVSRLLDPALGRAEVRLPRRALPVPAVGRAQRAEGPAPRRARGPRRRPTRDRRRPACTPRRRAPRRGGIEPRLVVERAPGPQPGHGVRDRRRRGAWAAATRPRSASRTRSRPHATRASSARAAIVVLEDLGSTNGTYLNEELLGGPQPLHPRRPRADRRQRVHATSTADAARRRARSSAPTPAASAGTTRTPSSRARRCSRSPTAWAARRPARSPPAWPSRSSGRPARRRRHRRGAPGRLVAEANARIHELSLADDAARRHGHDADRGLRRRGRARDRPRRRQPRSTSCATATFERLTDDHSLVEELVRQGKLTAEEAEEHPQRSIITRALGPEAEVEVDTSRCAGRDGDVFLICSRRPDLDGLRGAVGEILARRAVARRGRRGLVEPPTTRRPRQHHRRPLPPRGGRRAG